MKLRIGAILEEKGMNVTQFAELAKIARGTALSLKRGESTRVDLGTLGQVCDALAVEPGDLFEYSPSRTRPARKAKAGR